MKQLIITAFALSAVSADSSDTAVMEALQGKFNDLKKERDDFENKLQAFQDEQIEAVIEAHAKTNKSVDEKRDIFRKIGKTSGVDALMAVLDAQPTTPNASPGINSIIQTGKADGARAAWSWDEWQEKDPRGLEALAESQPEAYKQLYNEKFKK